MTESPASPPRPSLARRILFRVLGVALSLVATAIVLEIGARLLVPEAAFRVYSNIYARDADPRIG